MTLRSRKTTVTLPNGGTLTRYTERPNREGVIVFLIVMIVGLGSAIYHLQ